MSIYNHFGPAMRVDLERTPYGRWKLTNKDIEPEGRIFQNIDDALISLRDQLRHEEWRNYNGNNINVNNNNANHQGNQHQNNGVQPN